MKKNVKEINKKNIVIIFGGKSTEHDISILSYLQVAENIDKQKYNILPVYISKNGEWFYSKKLDKIDFFKKKKYEKLKKVSILPNSDYLFVQKFGRYKPFIKIDCVVPIMHGINGEDGTLQGLLELANVPFTSCSVFASSVGISKYAQKVFFKSLNLPIIDFIKIEKKDFELKQKNLIKTIKFPVVVKPDKLGSSIGISFCKNKTELKKALELAFKFDNVVVVEKAIKNLKEVNISVMGMASDCKVSLTEQPLTTSSILTFEDKYLGNGNGKGKLNVCDKKSNFIFSENNFSSINNDFENKKLTKFDSYISNKNNVLENANKTECLDNFNTQTFSEIPCYKNNKDKTTKMVETEKNSTDKSFENSNKNNNVQSFESNMETNNIESLKDIKENKNIQNFVGDNNNITVQKDFNKVEKVNQNYNQFPKSINTNSQKMGVKSVGMQNINRIMPADIDDKLLKQVEQFAITIFSELCCKGVVRIDFIINKNKVFVNEINTIPGSLSYYLWKEKTFENLIDELIEIATKSWQETNKLNLIFDSHII